jgi:hypothetical protein
MAPKLVMECTSLAEFLCQPFIAILVSHYVIAIIQGPISSIIGFDCEDHTFFPPIEHPPHFNSPPSLKGQSRVGQQGFLPANTTTLTFSYSDPTCPNSSKNDRQCVISFWSFRS